MAALPKRKGSSSRRNRRRSQDALKAPGTSACPKCKVVKRPHFKCPSCGFYGSIETKSSTKTTSTTSTPKSTPAKDEKKN